VKVWALALAVALVLAGCGGGTRLSRSEFVARADALCRVSVGKLKALKNPGSVPELVTYLKHARPIQARFIEDARKLRPPKHDEADWKRAIAFDVDVLRDYDEMAAAARRNDRKALARISARLEALPAMNPYQQRLGLKGC